MSFFTYRTENTVSRFVNFLYEGFPTIPTDPNFSGPVDVVPYQAIPDSYNDLIQNYVRLRRQPHASDRKRPHMITRPPHAPGQTFELVVRFRGEVTDVDLGLLGNWTRRSDSLSCAKATRTLTLGASRDAPQAWIETLTAFNKLRQAIRHFVTETPGVSQRAPFTALPVRSDTHTPFQVAPPHLDVNHILQSLQDRWHLTDIVPTVEFQAQPGNALVPCHPSIIQVGAFVDVAATMVVTLNDYGRFYISHALKRVTQIIAAPDIINDNDQAEEGPVNDGEAVLDLGVAAPPNAAPEVTVHMVADIVPVIDQVDMVPEPQLAPPSPLLQEPLPTVPDVVPVTADAVPPTNEVDATATIDVDDLLSPYAQGIDFDIFQ